MKMKLEKLVVSSFRTGFNIQLKEAKGYWRGTDESDNENCPLLPCN